MRRLYRGFIIEYVARFNGYFITDNNGKYLIDVKTLHGSMLKDGYSGWCDSLEEAITRVNATVNPIWLRGD